MAYVLENLADGQHPGVRAIGDASNAPAGAVVVDEAPPAGYVWDAAAQSMRARSAAESLDYAKTLKRREIKASADAEYLDKVSMFDGDIVAGKWGRQVALNAYEASVRNTMQDIYSRLRQKIQAVNAATTIAEVEGIAWT
jgi:hypothetical protein